MGLDNGIILHIEDKTIPQDYPCILDSYERERLSREGDIEVAYWRKCWGIRGAIMRVLHMKDDEGTHTIDAEDLPAIRRALRVFLNPKNWEDADSIWEYEEMVEGMLQHQINLKWLETYLKAHPTAKCYFYDSY